MPAIKNGEGEIVATGQTTGTRPGPEARSDKPVLLSGEGLRVRLDTIPGFTDPDLAAILPFYFQAPPLNEFTWAAGFNWDTYDTLSSGQFPRPVSRKLKAFEFETLFTDDKWPWTLRKQESYTPNPQMLVRKLERIADSGTPIRLRAGQPVLWGYNDLDIAVALTDVNPSEKAGEIDARYMRLAFIEFRHPSLQPFAAEKPTRIKLPLTLPIQELPIGQQTLYDLAKFWYGFPEEWRRIAKRNGLTRISPSQNLKIKFAAHRAKKITIPERPRPKAKRG